MLLGGESVAKPIQELCQVKVRVREIRMQIERDPKRIACGVQIVRFGERASQLRPRFQELVIVLDRREIPLNRAT